VAEVRVAAFSVSLDGFGAGPGQSLDEPLGAGGMRLHEWVVTTRSFSRMQGGDGGTTGVDNEFAERAMQGLGAWILGRNMFAPSRGPWPDDDGWTGWWGDEPPYHCDVYVLTHHARAPLAVGETTFHFVTDGIEAALERAKAAAKGLDVRIGGGGATIRQYLRAGLIDEMHLAVVPALLGAGESLLAGLDLPGLGYEVAEHAASEAAMHVVIRRRQ
jgi:dihydrofolate reductase